MSGQSLGLIETVGLTVAVEATDAALKSANVDLVGYELTKGGGLVTVKFTGEIGAMNAAVSAGVAAANRIGSVYAWRVIARTATGIDAMIASREACAVAPQDSLAQGAQPVMEYKVHVIPIVSADTDGVVDDGLAQPDEAEVAASFYPLAPVESKVDAEPAPVIIEVTADQMAHEGKKPLRAKAKGARRS
jgi:ethanolamine utilization protein EutM